MILWITGLSGSGKTTLATQALHSLREKSIPTLFLDGDILRPILAESSRSEASFSREGRLNLALRYSLLCQNISQQGIHVIIATISMFQEVYSWNRENLEDYFQVYLKVPIEYLKRRDHKGLYRRFYSGEEKNVAGLDLQVDEPLDADWAPEFSPTASPQDLAKELLQKLIEKDLP